MKKMIPFVLTIALLMGGFISSVQPTAALAAPTDADINTYEQPMFYPHDGEVDVPIESRRSAMDPTAHYHVSSTGYMITFQPGMLHDELRAVITNSKGEHIPYILEESYATGSYRLIPIELLDYQETYTVSVDYNGQQTTWSFTTVAEPERYDTPFYQRPVSTTSYQPEVMQSTGLGLTPPELGRYVYSEDLALSVKHGRFGYIDRNGQEVIPHQYSFGRNFSEGLAVVVDSNRWGYLDKQGNEVIPLVYTYAQPFSEGLGAVRDENRKWGFINKSGETVIPFIYDEVELFSYGTAAVTKNGKLGIIDSTGETIVPFDYISVSQLYEKLPSNNRFLALWINVEGQIDWFDKVDRKRLEFPGVEQVSPVPDDEGLLIAYQNGKYGIIDMQGNQVAPSAYERIFEFHEDLAIVFQDSPSGESKSGYLHKNGELRIPAVYDVALPVAEGITVVGMEHDFNVWNYSLLDVNGKVIKDDLIYTDISQFSNGRALVKKVVYDQYGNLENELYGLIDRQGNFIEPVEYTAVETYYDRNGKKIWELGEKQAPVEPEIPREVFDDSLGEPYADFQADQYWSQDMLWAISNGLISGQEAVNPTTGTTEKLLKPKDHLTEAQFLAILFRYSEQSYLKMTSAEDPRWWPSVYYQIADRIELPTKGSLRNRKAAEAPMTRGDMAVILASYYNMKYRGAKPMNLQEAVQFMYDAGLSNGYPDANGNIPKTYESYRVHNILLREHVVSFMRNYDIFLQKRAWMR